MLSSLITKAYAATTTGGPPAGDLQYWVQAIFGWAVAVSGIIFVVMFLVGGIQYLTSAGNEEQAGKAKKLLVDAVIGLIVVLIAWAAGRWILQSLGISTGGVIPA